MGTSTAGALLSVGLNAPSDAPQANEDMLEFCWKGLEQPVNKWFPAVFLRETAAPYSEIKNMLGEVKKKHQTKPTKKLPSMTALTGVKGKTQEVQEALDIILPVQGSKQTIICLNVKIP